MSRIALGCLIVSLLLPVHASAQCAAAGEKDFQTLIDSHIKQIVQQQVVGLAEKAARDTPRAAALSQQTSAPSASGTVATLVNAAGFTELISAAFDRNVGSNSSDAMTVNLNPFALAAIGKPSVYYDQLEYQKTEYEWLRRVGGTVSFGGKGDSFDRDGDGKPDPALDSQKFDDIIGWELRARVYGSRDRRDPDNFKLFTTAAQREFLGQLVARKDELVSTAILRGAISPARNFCLSDAEWQNLKAQPWFADELDRAAKAATALNKGYADAADEIDNRMLWTVAMTGLQRGKQFGPDKLGASVRGTWRAATFNFDWMSVEGLGKAKTSNEFKAGAQYATQILKGGFLSDGIDASASGAYEVFDNVPDAKHDNNVKFQGKLEIPIMTGVTIPLSVTWANHSDLFSDGDRVFGHLGVNVDLSKVLQKNSPAAGAASGS